jgi:hypothetical protein
MINPETHLTIKTSNRAGSVPLPLYQNSAISRRPILRLTQSTKVTVDHKEIKRWVEARGGKPAAVIPLLQSETGQIGTLRIIFPDRPEKEALKEISWETFFELFDARHLAFLYQEWKETGERSRFNKFIKLQQVTLPEQVAMAA